MRIKKVKFLNINSLKGEWEIDFEKFDGLFLISGETGSGKSSILDAICASMYAQTPRQKNASMLMSKNTGECYSECEFEVNGKLYRSYFGIRRARNKPDGKLQDSKMTLFEFKDGEWEVIAEKVKEVKEKIIEITSFDFVKFTKSMMLAQGGFDRFLKAKDSEKASLLEDITGTKIYGEISKRVFENYSKEKNKLEILKAKIDTSGVLAPDEFEKLEKEINLFNKKYKNLKDEFKRKDKLIKDFQRFNELKNELISFQEEFKKVDEEILNTKNLYPNLDIQKKNLEKANNLRGEINSLKVNYKNLTKEAENKEAIIKKIKKELEGIYDINDIQNELQQTVKEFNLIKLKDISEFINKKFKLEKNIEQAQKIKEAKKEKEKLLKYLKNLNQNKKELNLQKENLQKEIDELKDIIESYKKIINFENERRKLKDGEPCPLCGSTTHPYAKGLPEFKDELKAELETTENKLKQIENEIHNIDINIGKIETELKRLDEILSLEDFDIEKLNKEIENIKAEIKKEKEKQQKRDVLQKRINELKELKHKFERFSYEKRSLEDIIKKRDEVLKEISEKEKTLNIILNNKPYEEFKKEITVIENRINNLTIQKEKINVKIDSIKKNLSEFNQKEFEAIDTEKIKEEINDLDEKLKNLEEEINERKFKLKLHNQKQKEYKKLLEEINKKEEELKYLELLNKLIGQKDGGKYRTFVQNLTLKYLITLANNHLKNLTDRYILTKTSLNDLSLEVIDLYQANTIRDISTLSGGESFLVSLSLALGLTDLISDKIKIETLFIDEGFGTLDENTLNVVIEALEKLQMSGKMIGIISHVKMLKERITNQIRLIKKADGYSEITV